MGEQSFSKKDILKSYVSPLKLETFHSLYHQDLSVWLQNGKKVLTAGEVPCSYGEIHKIFTQAFRKTEVESMELNHVLILGFGAGTIASILQDEMGRECHMIGIEIDPVIIEIGREHFNTGRFKHAEIIQGRADQLNLMKDMKFDLIVCDVFLGKEVPAEVESMEFFEQVQGLLNKNGLFLFRKFLESFKEEVKFSTIEKVFARVFPVHESIKVNKQNKVLSGWNKLPPKLRKVYY